MQDKHLAHVSVELRLTFIVHCSPLIPSSALLSLLLPLIILFTKINHSPILDSASGPGSALSRGQATRGQACPHRDWGCGMTRRHSSLLENVGQDAPPTEVKRTLDIQFLM